MSEPLSTFPNVFHPWRAIRVRKDIEVRWEREAPGILGSWCEWSKTMRLNPTQNQRERRCTAAHELIHAERGDTTCDPSVHREAARRLIDLEALGEALATYGEDAAQVADELWVDEDTLRTRLQHLHPSERGYLRRRLAMREETA